MYVYLDFESYYDDEYSLKKMPTAQYVRDRRWRCLGAAIAFGSSEPVYVQPDLLPSVFEKLDWSRATLVVHNAGFDLMVLTHHYGHHPNRVIDTVSVARWLISQGHLEPDMSASLYALAPLVGMTKGDTSTAIAAGGQALADYGLDDLEIMRRFLGFAMQYPIPDLEWDLIDIHAKLSGDPVLDIDIEMLDTIALSRDKYKHIYDKLRKDDVFARLLSDVGVECETKTTPKGNVKYAFAKTDTFMQDLQQHRSPIVQKLGEMRSEAYSSINHTRARRLCDIGAPLPVPVVYYGTHTGRSSGSDNLNMLNLPRVTDTTQPSLRRSIRAQPGHKLVICDSGQIEARVVNYLAGQDDALDRFRAADAGEAVDAYRQFGGLYVYNVPPEDIGKRDHRRYVAKQAVLGLGFGQGVRGFVEYCAQFGIVVEPEEARHVVEVYRRTHSRVSRYLWDATLREVLSSGRQVLRSGRVLTYPDIHSGVDAYGKSAYFFRRPSIFSGSGKRRRVQKIWHGLTTENAVQAEARDIVLWQIVQMHKAGWRLVLTTYDEGVWHVPEDQAEACLDDALTWFRTAPPWMPGLPLTGEGVISDDYGVKP